MLTVEGLFVRYGALTGLRDANVVVSKGELVTLIGANGGGKSSLLGAIAGLVYRAQGRIVFDGTDISHMQTDEIVRMGIALCPEGRGILPRMTVRENLLLGAYHRRSTYRNNLARVVSLFPILEERLQQTAGTLSGGQQQMLSIGRALMAEPRLLMLDEPSLGLAPIVVDEILAVISELTRDGLTVLLAEETPRKALGVADRAYVLENGQVVMEGSAAELLDHEDVTAAYLGRGRTPADNPPNPPV